MLTQHQESFIMHENNYALGFPTRFLPKPKNRVTRSFFKTENRFLGACKPRFFGFEF